MIGAIEESETENQQNTFTDIDTDYFESKSKKRDTTVENLRK